MKGLSSCLFDILCVIADYQTECYMRRIYVYSWNGNGIKDDMIDRWMVL